MTAGHPPATVSTTHTRHRTTPSERQIHENFVLRVPDGTVEEVPRALLHQAVDVRTVVSDIEASPKPVPGRKGYLTFFRLSSELEGVLFRQS